MAKKVVTITEDIGDADPRVWQIERVAVSNLKLDQVIVDKVTDFTEYISEISEGRVPDENGKYEKLLDFSLDQDTKFQNWRTAKQKREENERKKAEAEEKKKQTSAAAKFTAKSGDEKDEVDLLE